MNIYIAIKSILNTAHEWGVIESNPMDGAERPSANKKKKEENEKGKKRGYSVECGWQKKVSSILCIIEVQQPINGPNS
jgi:hypothetical protein